jgi:ABC-type phosphate transport system substrate-binding protein
MMNKAFFLFALLCVMQLTDLPLADADNNKAVIAIVVPRNQDIKELKLAPDNLNLIYWRKQLYWPKGILIKPVNLRSEHPIRLQFSQTILGSSPEAQIDYWNGQYFNGVLPPYSVKSEEAVLRYVSQTKGAIGYVDACFVDERVKAVLWINANNQVLTNNPTTGDCGEKNITSLK